MKVPSSISPPIDTVKASQVENARAKVSVDVAKQATIAQTTVKLVQEALAKSATVATSMPSAQLSVDGSRISRLAGADKAKDAEKLDTAKLDAIKKSIEEGSFQVDYGTIAQQLVEQSLQRGSKRG